MPFVRIPLGIEHLTGSLAATITHVGTHDFPGAVQLRATTKFGAVEPLLDLPHNGRTRIRVDLVPDRGIRASPSVRQRESAVACCRKRQLGLSK